MKKALILVLMIVMMAVTMTACGGSSDQGKETDTQTPAQTAGKEETTAVSEDGYMIIVTESDGTPVVGASVQFCSDTQCTMEKTDDMGCVTFKEKPGKYTVHILKAEGYVLPEEDYEVPEEYGMVRIVLEKE